MEQDEHKPGVLRPRTGYVSDPWQKWGLGAVVPSLLVFLAVVCWSKRVIVLPHGQRWPLMLSGSAKVALGMALLGLAIFLLSRCLLEESERLWRLAGPGKIIGILVLLCSLAYVVYSVALS